MRRCATGDFIGLASSLRPQESEERYSPWMSIGPTS
jgi:hypothetical protein